MLGGDIRIESEGAGTVAKTVKHTPGFWNAIAAKAEAKGLTLREAMRQVLRERINTG
ncbi:MAG: hypothetical protein U0587_11155 [Candidatus Binatia bacterium]